MKKILFIYLHDSYKIIVDMLNDLCLSRGCETTSVDYEDGAAVTSLQPHHYDAIFIGLGGKVLHKFVEDLRDRFDTLPVLSVAFPGITYHKQELGFICRSNADNIMFNSQANYQDYMHFCHTHEIDYRNAIVTGFPQLLHRGQQTYAFPPQNIVYIDHSIVPLSYRSRMRVLKQLMSYAKKYPDRAIKIISASSRNAHACLFPLHTMLKKKVSNVEFITGRASQYLDSADLCLGFSSSVLMDAISRGIPTFSLSDFGLHDEYGNRFFQGSGLLLSFQKVLSDDYATIKLNKHWLEKNMSLPTEEGLYAALFRKHDQLQNQFRPETFYQQYKTRLGRKVLNYLRKRPIVFYKMVSRFINK